MLDATLIRPHFPILKRSIVGKRLAYLDNASTTQKPTAVIERMKAYCEQSNANIHRGIHTLSEESTALYEEVRKNVASFIGASDPHEIVFTKNCTESINLVAWGWAENAVKEGDEIIVSAYEHHANLIPWQELAKRKGAKLSIIPLDENLNLDLDAYRSFLSERTRLVCVTAQSNVLGIIPSLVEIIDAAHQCGALVLIDGAQHSGHAPIDVTSLGCDFFVFSAHKMLGPTGVGVLWARYELLESMSPFLFGGDMITTVRQYDAEYREPPWKFEAGTPNIAGIIAFGAAIDFLRSIGMEKIQVHDQELYNYTVEQLSVIPHVTLFGKECVNRNSIVSFTIDTVHPHDIASILNEEGVAIRSGAHCAEPLMQRLCVPATARVSTYLYNTKEEIDRVVEGVMRVKKMFHV